MTGSKRIERALLSVSDKTGLVELARELAANGVEIISTGGTAAALRDAGLDVKEVSDVTGFPEMMDGRVKTLHPRIHGALLGLRDDPAHLAAMSEHGIEPIDLVVINLYPFEQTIAKEGVTRAEAVENIDIGGPAMIRSASKNWRDVAVITDASQYGGIIDELRGHDGALTLETRTTLAAAAYARTAEYDRAIAGYLATEPTESSFAQTADIRLAKVADLRYGENPHQRAALYSDGDGYGIANAELLQGKEMSFNNYVDADAARALVEDLNERAVAIIKHTNPSGVGTGATNEEAYRRALSTDPVSAFGGIVAFNRQVDAAAAAAVIEVFSEVIIAPDYDGAALDIFRTKKNLRVLRLKKMAAGNESGRGTEYKQLSGGFLVQDADTHTLSANELKIVTKTLPTPEQTRAMLFAWTVCKHVRSNAIVFANGEQTLGVGAGQMNRVDSVRIAAIRAERFGLSLAGSALASDAFFPFRDNVDEAARCAVSAIIQPGGSMRDEESIAAADEYGITMAFTGVRHFKH